MLLIGKSTISMAMFNSFLYVYQRVNVLGRKMAALVRWSYSVLFRKILGKVMVAFLVDDSPNVQFWPENQVKKSVK